MNNRLQLLLSQSPVTTYRWPFPEPNLATEFEQLCREQLGRGGRDVRIVEGFAIIDGVPGIHALHNLADTCAKLPTSEWRREIETHLQRSWPKNIQKIIDDVFEATPEQNAERLVVRLRRKNSMLNEVAEDYVWREDLPGLTTALALDVGGSIIGVPRNITCIWKLPDDQLFARALDNVPKFCDARPCGFVLPPPMRMRCDFMEGGAYAATRALRFQDTPLSKGKHGNILGLPVRDSLISWPIDEWPSEDVLGSLFSMAMGRHAEGPYPVTKHLYWLRPDGGFELQRCVPKDGKLMLLASTGFAQLRDQLRGESACDERAR